METMTQYWNDVEQATKSAKLIAWDTCHKIYLAMDSGQEKWFRENYGDDIFVGTPDEMLKTLRNWWDNSCWLRFISAVETNDTDPNDGFTHLIPQFAEEEDEEDEEDF